MTRNKFIITLTSIIILSAFLRFYQLDKIPTGLYEDEASQGYNAYSILLSGKDEYGKTFPIFIRSFGDFKSPLYTYLTIIPIFIFGPTIFSVRLTSAICGVLIVILTALITKKINANNKIVCLSALIVGISPWAIFFSRSAIEANLALLFFLLSVLFFIESLKKPWLITIAAVLLAISTYAYHAERMMAWIFLPVFLWFFRKIFFDRKIILIITILLFIFIQIPELILLTSPASLRRISKVNYWDYILANEQFPQSILTIVRKFFSQFSAYISPKNLFFEPDSQSVRSIPQLSVFFSWMIIPFFVGLIDGIKQMKSSNSTLLAIIGLVTLIPASLTGEPFYTLRILPLLWLLSVIIAIGCYKILLLIKIDFLRYLTIILILALSIWVIYTKYFILLKYERSGSINYNYPLIEISKKTLEIPNKQFLIDNARGKQIYGPIAFYRQYNPFEFQKQNSLNDISKYYNTVDLPRKHVIDNVELRSIDWGKDPKRDQIIISDNQAVSPAQVIIHNLKQVFEFKDLTGNTVYTGYQTNP